MQRKWVVVNLFFIVVVFIYLFSWDVRYLLLEMSSFKLQRNNAESFYSKIIGNKNGKESGLRSNDGNAINDNDDIPQGIQIKIEFNEGNQANISKNHLLQPSLQINRTYEIPTQSPAAITDYKVIIEKESDSNSKSSEEEEQQVSKDLITRSPTAYVFQEVNGNIHYLPSKDSICASPASLQSPQKPALTKKFFIAGQMNVGK